MRLRLYPFMWLAFALLACQRDRHRSSADSTLEAGTTAVTSAIGASRESAVRRLVEMRCSRELACEQFVSEYGRRVNHQACLETRKAEYEKELSAAACPRGIDGNQLNECLGAMQTASCSDPVDELARVLECRREELCIGPQAP